MITFIRNLKSSTFVLITVIILYSLLLITSHHYERLTGDATLYLSIAEKYLNGDLINAVNGYWGPLLSWLLIPFLFFGASHVFALNALNLIFGVLTIIGIWRLSYRFELDEKVRCVILIPLVPIMLFISLIQPMDFLLLCILVAYLAIIFSKDYPDKMSNAALCGVLGASAYFSKPYGLPFFLSHFLLINICHYFRGSAKDHKKNVVRNAIVGLLLFSLLSGIWIALISSKYNRITFSNMGRGVFAALGPGSEHESLEKGDPIIVDGFFEPPNESAFVIYEDPSYARKKTWSPLESSGALKHFSANVTENIFEAFRIYESYSRLSIAIVIAYIILVFTQQFNTVFSRIELLYPLLTIMLYTAGYMPFHFESRYLWIVNILLLLMGGKVLYEMFHSECCKKMSVKGILTAIFIVSFTLTPVKTTLEIGKNDINKKMHALGTELSSQYDIHGNIASNRQKKCITIHDSWHHTFRLAYWLNSRYFGQAKDNISDEDLEQELRKFKIDYYFFWDTPDGPPHFLSRYKELTQGEIPGLKIFSLRDKL